MNKIIISTIDWEELSKRYNGRYAQNVSFLGSSAYVYYHEENGIFLTIELQVEKETIISKYTETFFINKDSKTGKYYYEKLKSLGPRPPNLETIIVGHTYFLFNIVSDYIEPFLKSNSLPLLTYGPPGSSSQFGCLVSTTST